MAALIVRHWKLALVWMLSLVAASAITSSAQTPQRGQLNVPDGFILENPVIVSGNDLGFRLERVRDGVPIGGFVVRVDGRWVAPQTR